MKCVLRACVDYFMVSMSALSVLCEVSAVFTCVALRGIRASCAYMCVARCYTQVMQGLRGGGGGGGGKLRRGYSPRCRTRVGGGGGGGVGKGQKKLNFRSPETQYREQIKL